MDQPNCGRYTHICISYPLAYLKYLNKYSLTTDAKYDNTICMSKLSYVNSSDMQMY